jgi:hypothetical protein
MILEEFRWRQREDSSQGAQRLAGADAEHP